ATVWTGDPARGHRIAARIKAGQIGINMPYTAFPGIPFGGYKQSGFGRELGLETLDLYLETKSVLVSTSPKPFNPFGLSTAHPDPRATGVGANRIGGSAEEDRAHELAAGWMEAAGFEVDVDPAGNLIGRTGDAHVWTGSHLDSVPNGGKFDGALGVVAGIEAVGRVGRGA